MCFSPEASLFSFIFGMFGAYLVYTINTPFHKAIAIFFAYVACIQLIEFILWINQSCTIYNKIASITNMIFINSQPIVMALVILYFSPYLNEIIFLKTNAKTIIYGLLAIYIFFIIPYTYDKLTNNNYKKSFCTLKSKKTKHLHWNWHGDNFFYRTFIYTFYTILFMIIPWIGFPKNNVGLIFATYVFLSFLFSLMFYKQELGSMWCFFTVFGPILYYFLYKYNIFRFID